MRWAYLAGSIMDDPDPRSWRSQAAEALEDIGWNAFNPLDYETSGMSDRNIVKLDYGLILNGNAVLANVNVPSWGTAMEIVFAASHGIPVVAFADEGARFTNSRWLKAHTLHLAKSMQLAIDYLGGFCFDEAI